MNDKLEDARAGCEKIDNTLKRKQLSVNYDKSKSLIMGKPKYRKNTLKEIKERHMNMGGVMIEHLEKEKYLRDMIHEKGCKESITATIKARTNGLVGKGEEIIQVSETAIMGGIGNSLAATKLFEAQVIPALLHNCESWIRLNETHISDLQDFQDKFMRKLLRLPPSTPKAILHWDSGLKRMKWRIAEKKLLFLRKTMEREDSKITRKALLNANIHGTEWTWL